MAPSPHVLGRRSGTGLFALALALLTMAGTPSASAQDFDICAAVLRTPLAGVKVTAGDLPGRVVLLIMNDFNEDAKWTEFAVRTTGEFVDAAPPGAVVPVLATNNAKVNAKAWNDRHPDHPISYILQRDLSIPGLIFAGGPRFVLIDADGKVISDMIIDGRDLAGNSRYQSKGILMKADDVRRIAANGPGSPVKAGDYAECKVEAAQLAECAMTSAPFTPVLKALRALAGVAEKGDKGPARTSVPAKGKDGGRARAEALQLLAGAQEHLANQLAVIQRNAAENPLLAMRALQRALLQTAGDESSKPFEALAKTLKSSQGFQEELKGAEALNVVRTAAADIYWGSGDPDAPRAKEKIVAIKQGLDVVVAKHAALRAGKSAAALRKEWDAWAAKAINPLPW